MWRRGSDARGTGATLPVDDWDSSPFRHSWDRDNQGIIRTHQSKKKKQNKTTKNKGKTLQITTVESQHGSLQFTPNVTHWSVKCIYATPNKQDNVDSVSEVVWIKHLVHDCGQERPIPDYSWKSVIDIDINSTCSLTFLPWIYIKYQ